MRAFVSDRPTMAGILFILVSATLLSPVATGSVKFLTSTFGIFEIVWIRAVGQTLWMLLFFVPRHGWGVVRSNRPGLQLIRSGLMFLGTVGFVVGVQHVDIATAHTINFTLPFIVVALSVPILGERVGLHRWSAVVVGFIGTLIVIRPGSDAIPLAALWILVSAACWAVVQIMNRRMSTMDSSQTSAIYTYIVALVVTTPFAPFGFEPAMALGPGHWLAIGCVGLFGGMRHYTAIRAAELAPASLIAPFNYCELVGATLVGLIVFTQVPDGWTWLGAGVIIASGLYIARRESLVRAGGGSTGS